MGLGPDSNAVNSNDQAIVEVGVALPTGTNSIGQVTANAGTNLNTSALALDSTVAKDSSLSTINTSINTLLKPADTLAAVTAVGSITNALPAGTNLLGKVGIDQTTPGTTNGVQVNAALPTGTNSIGQVTANAGTNLNTSALNLETTQTAVKTSVEIMDDWDESDRAKVNPIVGQAGVQGGSGTVSANSQRVVLATDVALPAGTNLLGKVGIDQTTPGTTNGIIKNMTNRPTYSASTSGSAITTTSPQDVFTITGSASKTIKIAKIGFSMTQTTASTNSISLIKRAANSGGTSSSVASNPFDSNNAAATATVLQYTANPTPGASVGGFFFARRTFIPTATGVFLAWYDWEFDEDPEQRPTLRGTNQTMAINLGGTTVAGANPSFYVIWTEE